MVILASLCGGGVGGVRFAGVVEERRVLLGLCSTVEGCYTMVYAWWWLIKGRGG